MVEETKAADGVSRRTVLRRAAAGAAIAWTAPVVTSWNVPAYARGSFECGFENALGAACGERFCICAQATESRNPRHPMGTHLVCVWGRALCSDLGTTCSSSVTAPLATGASGAAHAAIRICAFPPAASVAGRTRVAKASRTEARS